MPLLKALSPNKALQISKKFWFISLCSAQIVFVTYLALGYGLSAFNADITQWNRFNSTAYVENDALGNTIYGLHVLLAIVMIIGGSLQLLPKIRARFSKFHRINGRLFVVLACIISFAGLYLITVRGTVGNLFMHSLTTFSGLVVIMSSFFAVAAARNKNIKVHQTWAIRLYLAANGVLFFRLLIFSWFLIFGTLGVNTEDFTGPTVVSISLCSYILPLIFFELVQRAEKSSHASLQYLSCFLLVFFAFCFFIGLFGISLASWYPALIG